MGLDHEVPTALQVRPTVTIRQIPGRTIRLPSRGATILLIALIVWGIGVAIIHRSWSALAGVTLIPASILALLIELKPRGKTPLGWVYVYMRHRRRAPRLMSRRLVASASRPGHRR
jgi:hypothetical protein